MVLGSGDEGAASPATGAPTTSPRPVQYKMMVSPLRAYSPLARLTVDELTCVAMASPLPSAVIVKMPGEDSAITTLEDTVDPLASLIVSFAVPFGIRNGN